MDNKKLTRENINNQLRGFEMQIRYLRDALICTCMDMPISQFVLLDGNCLASEEEQMLFLNRIVSRIDMDFLKDAKSYIFNTKNDELARKFCELDLVVWQLIMLSSRYEEKNETVKHIAGFAGELLQLVYFLKKEMLHEVQMDLRDNLWEKFCNQIYFADGKKGKQMHDSLLNLPNNPAYKHYFNVNEYERITAYDADLHRRARRNSWKKN